MSPVIGALAGTAALAAHNAFDFSLEIPGVALVHRHALRLDEDMQASGARLDAQRSPHRPRPSRPA